MKSVIDNSVYYSNGNLTLDGAKASQDFNILVTEFVRKHNGLNIQQLEHLMYNRISTHVKLVEMYEDQKKSFDEKLAVGHNYHKLRNKDVLTGHRLLDEDEVYVDPDKCPLLASGVIYMWDVDTREWESGPYCGNSDDSTYCTQYTKEELKEFRFLSAK